jgi:hypothetical protein
LREIVREMIVSAHLASGQVWGRLLRKLNRS